VLAASPADPRKNERLLSAVVLPPWSDRDGTAFAVGSQTRGSHPGRQSRPGV